MHTFIFACKNISLDFTLDLSLFRPQSYEGQRLAMLSRSFIGLKLLDDRDFMFCLRFTIANICLKEWFNNVGDR